jgi:simple sugar transport system permease protein
MATSSASVSKIVRPAEYVSPGRRIVMGCVFLALAAVIWLIFSFGIASDATTTFVLYPGGSKVVAPDWIFRTKPALDFMAFLAAAAGAYQLARGFGRRTNAMLGLVAGFFIFAFLAWGASGDSLNLAGLLKVAVVRAVPLALGAFSGIFCERSGIFNIAIEGMMLTGAFCAALFGSLVNTVFGLFTAILAGVILAWVLAVLSIKYKVDQIISGTVINIFATGITSFLSAKFLQKYQTLNDPGRFGTWDIPGLSKIPFFGPVFFSHNLFIYTMFLLAILLTILFFYTRWGLRTRAVGEHPKAADTLGINVNRTRYISVMIGGAVAGFAGAYFVLGSVGRFDEVMTAGRGFVGLAAMIFGSYNPFGALGAGMLFGFAESLASKLTILRVPIPNKVLEMAPYLVTMIILAGVVGRVIPPAAGGKPYEKE